jgi:hypothetical protein
METVKELGDRQAIGARNKENEMEGWAEVALVIGSQIVAVLLLAILF